MEAVASALRDLQRHPDKMVLLGMTPEHGPEAEYGYIQPKQHSRMIRTRAVAAFIEKPPLPLARRLIYEGALWNTIVFTVRSTTLWQDGARHCAFAIQSFGLIQSMLGSVHAPGLSRTFTKRFRTLTSPLRSAHRSPKSYASSGYRMSVGALGNCCQYPALAA
jgi:hypothetical protein